MKKTYISWLLAAALCAASAAPVSGAEFISSPEETAAFFTAGETINETAPSATAPAVEDTQTPSEVFVIKTLRITKPPQKAKYWKDLDFSVMHNDTVNLNGLSVEITYGNNQKEIVTIDNSKEIVIQDDKYFLKDAYDNVFHLEWTRPITTGNPGIYQMRAKTELRGNDGTTTILESAPYSVMEIATPSANSFPKLNHKETYGVKSVTSLDVQGKKAYAVITPSKDGLYKIYRTDRSFTEYETDPTCIFDSKLHLIYGNGTTGIYSLKAGQTYYVRSEEAVNTSLKITVEYMAPVVSMKLVTNPSHNHLYVRNGNLLDGPFFHNGKVQITYDDGTSEIISTNRKGWEISLNSKYGFSLIPSFSTGDGWGPGIGVCDYYLTMEYSDVKATIPNVEIKPESQMPTLKEKGTITAEVNGSHGAWFRLKTGKGKYYKIECLEGKSIVLEDKNGQSYMGNPDGNVYKLKPDSLYYIRNEYHEEIPQSALTYRVTPTTGQKDISLCKISFDSEHHYTGKSIKPSVKVSYKGKKLKAKKDYKVSYSSNQKIGTGKIKITGLGKYTGTVKKSFSIIPGKTKITALKRISKGKVALSWSKSAGASGYVVLRSTTGEEWKTAGTVKATSFTDKKAKKGTIYHYKIQPYYKSGKTLIYGEVSSVETAI